VRLLVIASHVIQYFAPLYRALAKAPGVSLTVLFRSSKGLKPYRDAQFGKTFQWDVPLVDGYRASFLSDLTPEGIPVRSMRHRLQHVIEAVSQNDAVLLASLLTVEEQAAFWTAKLRGRRLLYRSESNRLSSRPWHREFARAPIIRSVFKAVDAGLYIGARNREYLSYHGIPDDRLFFAPYSVDNDYFQTQALRFKQEVPQIRERFGLSMQSPVILFSGKLIAKKQPLLLLEAFKRVRQEVPCQLLFAGDGDLRRVVEEAIRGQVIPDVRLAGFLNQSEMPRAYAAADLLVLPSGEFETWGLVVNEAMCFGLPAIVSDRVGSASDLVSDGVTGYVVPFESVDALVGAIRKTVGDESLRRRMGQQCVQRVNDYSIAHTVAGIRSACGLGSPNRQQSGASPADEVAS
jgi:glycosyltransferase involved in cell wall biosynthesis